MSCQLNKHVAVVTGAESGIGKAIAELFAAEGANIAFTFFEDEKAARDTASNVENCGSKSFYAQTDVSEESEVEDFYDKAIAELGLPTILVNDAGINQAGILVRDMSLTRWQRIIAVNLTGPFLFCRRFARELRKSGGRGKIINVSSIHEDVAVPGGADYCASKGGLRNLTRCLALELANQRINVNNIAPGMVLTQMNERAVNDSDFLATQTENIPLRRAAKPEEVARLALFLALPESDYATGSTFFLDGGLMMNLGQGA